MSRRRRRRDAQISREGSVHLRRALLGLGIGLQQKGPAARTLRERGKPGGIVACALTHRAGKIAFAMGPRPCPPATRPAGADQDPSVTTAAPGGRLGAGRPDQTP